MIGYYVDHRDPGAAGRFQAVAAHLPGRLVGAGSGPPPASFDGDAPWLPLPADDDAGPETDPTAGGLLERAPLRHRGLRDRMTALADWLRDTDAQALVVDGSVEVTMLGRLLGVPTVMVASRGHRDDRARRLAYDAATCIVAPWHAVTQPDWPRRRLDRTHWIGGLSRYDGHTPSGRELSPEVDGDPRHGPYRDGERCVVLVTGDGGHELDRRTLHVVADATDDWCWHVVGDLEPAPHDRVIGHGAVDDLWPLLCHAQLVVGPDSGGLLDEAAAARARFVSLPPPRASREQHDDVRRFADAGLVTVAPRGTRPPAWPDVLKQATQLDPHRWEHHHDGNGGERFARLLDTLVEGGTA